MDLSVIGISPEAVEVYRYFLRHRGEGLESVRQAVDLDPETVEAAVETLETLCLLDITDRHRVVAAEPRVGIERLIERHVERLNTEIRNVLAARDVIGSFVADQKRGEEATPALDIERVEGLDKVRQRIDDLAFFSYRETLCLHPGGPLSQRAIETALPLDARSLRRGLGLRSVYHPSALDDPAMASYLRDIAILGAQVRFTEDAMERMVVFDRSVAVVPIKPKDSARGALLVREPGLVSQLVTYFDSVWQAGTDLAELTGAAADPPRLSGIERQVLAALATSDKDEIAARELNVSVRTYRRYVADLMNRLGAVNRFQAALRAKEENWI
ncbi:MAG TPA: helix-turn-helix transcriptional regulator [Streptosporangiaceae bacterium]